MTQSRLEPRHYIDPAVFEREQTHIFRKLWIFAGLRTLLAEPDAFLTRVIGGIPILVQNCSDQIKAFENQCAHRQMPLQFEDYGKRRLACRYHGWVYDANGFARSIPGEHTLYQYPNPERDALCLREFAVEIIGNLIFVNLDEKPLPISAQFCDDFRAQLESITTHFGDQAIHAHIPGRYNWKLNFENVLDSNHVPFVHPATFKPLIVDTATDASASVSDNMERIDNTTIDETKLSSLSYATTMQMQISAQPWHALVDRFRSSDTYYNFFVYPNVNFISVGGLVFLVQQFHPVSPHQTDVIFSLTTASERRRINALPAILWGHLKGEKRVLDEDRVLLEALQANMHANGRRANHGAYEHQIRRVASVYLRLLNETEFAP